MPIVIDYAEIALKQVAMKTEPLGAKMTNLIDVAETWASRGNESLDIQKAIDNIVKRIEYNRTETACASCPQKGSCGRIIWTGNLDRVRVTGCSNHPDQEKFRGHSTTMEIDLTSDICGTHGSWQAVWANARDNAGSGTCGFQVYVTLRGDMGGYLVERMECLCDTSTIPSIATISGCEFHAYENYYENRDATDQDVYLVQQDADPPTIPHDPVVNGDFDRTQYTIDQGHVICNGQDTWRIWTITDPATFINRSGLTRWQAQHAYDYGNTAPTWINLYIFDDDTGGNPPHLSITYDMKFYAFLKHTVNKMTFLK